MKNKKQIIPLLVLSLAMMSFTGDKPAYMLFEQGGKKVKYEQMLKDLAGADIIFFGELHTDPISHWLQIELAMDLFGKNGTSLVIGAEMFEADNQLILDEYLDSLYATDKFEAEMRLWDNYQTDYKPLVEFARIHGIPVVATNIPRRYASMVHKGGFEALDQVSAEGKTYIAPLPVHYDPELKCYKDMLSMPGMEGHVNENFPKAQAIKDATMAHFILENWSKGHTLFHLNGSYHSRNFEGIVWHLLQEDPALKIRTIEAIQQKKPDELEEAYENIASYIVAIPERMTKTNR